MKPRTSNNLKILLSTLIFLSGCGAVSEGQRTSPSLRSVFDHRVSAEEPAVLKSDASLTEILAYGAAVNEGLKGAFLQWRAAADRIPQAAGFPDPRFGYAYFLQEVETRVGPQRHKISLSQGIPGMGKLGAKEELARRRAAIKEAEYEKARTDLYRHIRLVYANYYFKTRHKAITLKNLERLQALEPVVTTAYKTGVTPYAALLRVQMRISKETEILRTVEDSLVKAAFEMNALLNRPGSSALPTPELPPIPDMPTLEDEAALRALLRQSNPNLVILKRKMAAAGAMENLAGKLDNPDFMLGADWVVTDESEMNVDDNGKDPLMFMVSFNIPLYRDKYNAAVKAARSSLRAVTHKHRENENLLTAGLQSLLTDAAAAGRRIRLHDEDLLPKARQAFEVARTAFKTGKAEYLQMLDALQLMFDLELAR
ncbi:TolC family protein, partial [Planctomycetota bacterium]